MTSLACHTLVGHSIFNGLFVLPLIFICSFTFYQWMSETAGIASPNYKGSRMVGWNKTSFHPILKSLSWEEQGSEKCLQWLVLDFVDLRLLTTFSMSGWDQPPPWPPLQLHPPTHLPYDFGFDRNTKQSSQRTGNGWRKSTGSRWSEGWAIFRIIYISNI